MARQGTNAKGSGNARKGGGGASSSGGASSGAIRAGEAFVELFAKDGRLVQGLKNASDMLKRWAGGMAKIGAAAIGGGLGFLAPFGAALKSVTDRGTELSRIAKVYGDTVENISALQYAADRSGAGAERLQQAMENLPERIYDAANGSAELNKEFAKIGVNAQDIVGMSFTEQLLAMADGFSKLDTATQRAGLASKLFSDVGLEGMIPLLSAGSGQLREWMSEAERVGAVLSTADARKSVEVSGMLLQVWTGLKSVFYEAGSALVNFTAASKQYLNPINELLASVRQWVRANQQVIIVLAAVGAGVAVAGAFLFGLSAVIGALGTVLGAVVTAWTGLLTALGLIATPIGAVTALLIVGVAAWLYYSGKGKESTDAIKDGWNGVVELLGSGDLRGAAELAFAGLNAAWQTAVAGMTAVWRDFVRLVKDSLALLDSKRQSLVDNAAANIGLIGERAGLLPKGTGDTLLKDRNRAEAEREKNLLDEINRNKSDRDAAVDAANAKLREAQDNYNRLREAARNRVPGAANGELPPGVSPGSTARIGQSTLGAFGFGNAAQMFGGSSSFQTTMLNETKKGNALLAVIGEALGNGINLRVN